MICKPGWKIHRTWIMSHLLSKNACARVIWKLDKHIGWLTKLNMIWDCGHTAKLFFFSSMCLSLVFEYLFHLILEILTQPSSSLIFYACIGQHQQFQFSHCKWTFIAIHFLVLPVLFFTEILLPPDIVCLWKVSHHRASN